GLAAHCRRASAIEENSARLPGADPLGERPRVGNHGGLARDSRGTDLWARAAPRAMANVGSASRPPLRSSGSLPLRVALRPEAPRLLQPRPFQLELPRLHRRMATDGIGRPDGALLPAGVRRCLADRAVRQARDAFRAGLARRNHPDGTPD